MPPAPNWTADNVTEVAILGHWSNSRKIVNVLHVQREEDDAAASARDVLNNWQDHIALALATNYVIDGCRYRDRNEAAGVTGMLLPDAAKHLTGVDSAEVTAPNVSMMVHKITEVHAGQKPGRMYLPPPEESVITEDGDLSSAFRTSQQGNLNAFLSGLSGAGSNQLGVVHFKGPLDATGTFTPVTALAFDAKVATQRRRLR